ncbi:hypothetical protein [Nocardiopsis sp. MG754419]|uniref:hypothetical protein n=1 Tax=Nocardiopsis sp. MG754419 TaxID=2259865 RepID=UPI001BAC9E9E|nr:hypothetical protein [Nocardiopsis sp. MG754419]MBR8743502.1 hypothetical protein [Nocardiopsis sp. MG754419]
MTSVRRRAAALLLSAFAATAVLGAVPAQAAAQPGAEASSSSPGLLGGLFGDGGLVTIFIGNYQINH